jgi:hypothetical protein
MKMNKLIFLPLVLIFAGCAKHPVDYKIHQYHIGEKVLTRYMPSSSIDEYTIEDVSGDNKMIRFRYDSANVGPWIIVDDYYSIIPKNKEDLK